jgi:transcriptional regulator with XRE-family HTH domain
MLIQKLRLQHGWSQEQLAELSGLSVRTIQRLEQGQTASVESLKSIAAVFEINFATLKEPEMDGATSSTSQSIPPTRRSPWRMCARSRVFMFTWPNTPS